MTSVPHQLPLFPLQMPAAPKSANPTHDSEHQRARMLGRRRSDESRAKMSARAKGRVVAPETIAKQMATKRQRGSLLSGPAAPNWKGGRPWERFKDPEYIAWRTAVLERDGYVCQECGRRCKKHEKGLAAHHIQPYATHPDLRLAISNGRTLCRACHMLLHGKPVSTHVVPCACGCGTQIPAQDNYGRKRRYVNGHACRGQPKSEAQRQLMRERCMGRTLSAEHRAKIAASLKAAWDEGRRSARPG